MKIKRFVTGLAVIVSVAILAMPSFARGPGWGRGNNTTANWGMGPGYCWQTEKGYRNLTPEWGEELDQDGREYYEESVPNSPLSRWFGMGYGPGMGHGHMSGFGMGWHR